MAEFAQSQGVKNVYILNDKEAYGLGVATNFRDAARVARASRSPASRRWDPKASSYDGAVQQDRRQTGADAVFLGGLIDENGAQVIKDKVAVLGAERRRREAARARRVHDRRRRSTRRGAAAAGMFLSVAGRRSTSSPGTAKEFVDGLQPGRSRARTIDPYAIYGGQAAQVMLDAIAASDGSRSDVIAKLFATDVDGRPPRLVHVQRERRSGRGGSGAVVGFTIYKATTSSRRMTTIAPKPDDRQRRAGAA